jgi:5'-3' exoribonuclease 1
MTSLNIFANRALILICLKDFFVLHVGMGIPSYFRHLLQRYPHLLKDVSEKTKGNVLLVDFNCLIYGCAKSTKLPLYTHETREVWEAALIQEIRSYVLHLWTISGKPEEVVLAVDGVVPMAKIRQQRLRRFKGIWLAGKEIELGARAIEYEAWDTNCITPGTAFMDRLEFALKDLAKPRGWVVSSANEPGEGEQKLMEWVRARGQEVFAGKHVIVYGLDADLILLCMMHAANDATWSILREKQEFIKAPLTVQSNRPPCLTMSINGLKEVMFPDEVSRDAYIRDYIAGMCLLGNDFIPHNVGIHIRDSGHDRLVAALAAIHSGSATLIYMDAADGFWKWNREALIQIVGSWAATEREDIEHSFQKKYKMRPQPARSRAEQCMLPLQNLPIELAEESRIWCRRTGELATEWKDGYYREKRGRNLTSVEIGEKCAEYLRGLQWNIDYYTGQRAVSGVWMYPWTYAPLWSNLYETLMGSERMPGVGDGGSSEPLQPEDGGSSEPLQPQEQLSLVLPLESWWLIRDPILKALPSRIPHFWPNVFEFSTIGKRWLWECPPEIPIIVPSRLRAALIANQ